MLNRADEVLRRQIRKFDGATTRKTAVMAAAGGNRVVQARNGKKASEDLAAFVPLPKSIANASDSNTITTNPAVPNQSALERPCNSLGSATANNPHAALLTSVQAAVARGCIPEVRA